MTTPDEARECLERRGYTVTEVPINDNQVRLEIDELDAVVNIWRSTGTCNVQGHDQAQVQEELGDLVQTGRRKTKRVLPKPQAAPSGPKKVFIVYGHDTAARNELDAMLRRWGLEPLFLDQLPSHGNTIIEKLEYYQQAVEWAVVLLTPDDLGHPALNPSVSAPRPRQNVVLEMGMLLGKLGRDRVAMLYKQSEPQMELPSDIQGYIYIPYTTAIQETGQTLAKEMAAANFYDVPVSRI